ncbi:hypothetical protein V8G54_028234 [Vigna mungo]|uniref:Uncharacterized protein n=1 Tax=Vigna mungo TaxID=3915 RepID=A0AAQ3MSE2_VIGMU
MSTQNSSNWEKTEKKDDIKEIHALEYIKKEIEGACQILQIDIGYENGGILTNSPKLLITVFESEKSWLMSQQIFEKKIKQALIHIATIRMVDRGDKEAAIGVISYQYDQDKTELGKEVYYFREIIIITHFFLYYRLNSNCLSGVILLHEIYQ